MPKFCLVLKICLDVDNNKLYILESNGGQYITPIENLNEVPKIVANCIKENLKYIKRRKEQNNA